MYLMDQALEQMHAEGRAQTVLTVFDLRGFTQVLASCCFRRRHIAHRRTLPAQDEECRRSLHPLLR